ncbi:MAG: glycosyltransferase [Sediminibacterium sp.]
MNIAIHNLHETPNLFDIGIHNYTLDLLKDGHVKYLYIDFNKYHFRFRTIYQIYDIILHHEKIKSWNIPWENIEFIFSIEDLNRKCDVLLNFNSHLGRTEFSQRLKKFDGLKIYHVNDYFWNQPGSELNKLFESIGVDYLIGYASHDKHCKYFQDTFKNYIGKVIPLPFGYSDRFKNIVPFNERKYKAVALGSVNPLRPLEYPVEKFRESANFFPDESWFHKFRRKLVLQKANIEPFIDSMLPEFPRIKDFNYDLVKKFNEYRMFVSDESIFNFPPAKYFEGPACGSVLFCADHDCNKEFGFIDSVNCVMYKEDDINDLTEKISYYMQHENELLNIQKQGYNYVTSKFSHRQVASYLVHTINNL